MDIGAEAAADLAYQILPLFFIQFRGAILPEQGLAKIRNGRIEDLVPEGGEVVSMQFSTTLGLG